MVTVAMVMVDMVMVAMETVFSSGANTVIKGVCDIDIDCFGFFFKCMRTLNCKKMKQINKFGF